ncbi:MAG: peptide-methionine (R)-S-oxide reductase MsrB [Bacteroidetes bacterium]|nr:peptide-methionine (R)-S-oxide reductase MsrB [Bacteroidota bacterium]
MEDKVVKTEEEWKEELTDEEFRVLRLKGTEMAFTGEFEKHKEDGIYVCGGCGNKLFTSETKYDSHCGWPSFFEPVSENSIVETEDNTLGKRRIEITCAKCGGHLGHVFNDGPQPTGLRYCINSISLDFDKEEKAKEEAKEKKE